MIILLKCLSNHLDYHFVRIAAVEINTHIIIFNSFIIWCFSTYVVTQLGRHRSKSRINGPASAVTDEIKDQTSTRSGNDDDDKDVAENSSQDLTSMFK